MQAEPQTWSGGEPSSHKRKLVVPWQTRPLLKFIIFYLLFTIFLSSFFMNREELKNRTKQFAHRAVKLSLALPKNQLGRHIGAQLIRCSTSVAANYRAACIAQSKASFVSKLSIVIEEVDEACFWLEFIIEEELMKKERIVPLLQEAQQLTAIFVSSRKTLRTKKQ
jgi:four helix bundle protein